MKAVLGLALTLVSLVTSEIYSIVQDSSMCHCQSGFCFTLTQQITSPQLLLDHSLVSFSSGVRSVTNVSSDSVFVVKDAYCLAFQTIQEFIGNNAFCFVWSFDGNINYIRSEHGILFSVALGLLVIVIMPLIFVSLFAKQFQALSSCKYFRWVNKMKPLFVAFMGPYKDRYRGWTGLLLLVRQNNTDYYQLLQPHP